MKENDNETFNKIQETKSQAKRIITNLGKAFTQSEMFNHLKNPPLIQEIIEMSPLHNKGDIQKNQPIELTGAIVIGSQSGQDLPTEKAAVEG